MDVWHDPERADLPAELVLPVPLAEQDAALIERVAPLVAARTHSFLRAIKPDWRIEVTRHQQPLDGEDADAVADSAFSLDLIRLEGSGRALRTRREVLLASIAAATSGLSPTVRLGLHREGFSWAIENGRWDAVAQSGLERRFLELGGALGEVVAGARAGRPEAWGGAEVAAGAMARWRGVAGTGSPDLVRRRIAHHANRLAVFAEPEAILHYLLYRLEGGPGPAGS